MDLSKLVEKTDEAKEYDESNQADQPDEANQADPVIEVVQPNEPDVQSNDRTVKISLSTAYNIISKKILINKMSKECLTKQITYSSCSVRMQKIYHKIYTEKIKLIDQINTLYEHQLNDFTEQRQNMINRLIEEINILDMPTKEFQDLATQHLNLENEIVYMIKRIEYMESQIPQSKMITNYKIKVNDEEVNNLMEDMVSNCASEVRNLGI